MYTPPVYSKFYNSFAMMLGRRKVPRGQRSEQGWFRLVDWDEYEAIVGTSSLLTTRREALAREKAEEKALAREKAEEEEKAREKAEEEEKALAEPVLNKERLM